MSDYLAYLLPEVVTEILKRLPVKSLLRFRCVCKRWCSLISSPSFISQHLSSLSSSPSTLVRHYSKLHTTELYTVYNNDTFTPENSFTISFPFHEKSTYYRIVGYCNGLLCLSNDLFRSKDSIILWNPSIKRALVLPKPSIVSDEFGKCMFTLGFGFDSKNNDYKVVRFSIFTSVEGMKVPPKVEVYSVSLGQWRSLSIGTKMVRINEVLWSQAVIDGVVHWNGFSCENVNKVRNLVLRFDLGSEEFGEIGLPEAFASLPPTSFLVSTLKGSLSVVFYNDYMRNLAADFMSWCTIWVMKEYGNVESWEQLYKIELDIGLGMVIGTTRCGDGIFLSTNSGELVLFNCENGWVSSTGISGTKSSFFVDEYVESLVLLGKGEEVHGSDPEEDYETEDNEIEKDHWLRRRLIFNIIVAKGFNPELMH